MPQLDFVDFIPPPVLLLLISFLSLNIVLTRLQILSLHQVVQPSYDFHTCWPLIYSRPHNTSPSFVEWLLY